MIQANVPVRAGNGRRNIEAFTSLRGFASAIVVMAHVWSILDLPRLLAGNPSLVSSSRFVGSLLNGSAAVQIFFVLSACVLAVSSGSHSGTQHAPWITRFYVRRVFRIYPALWVSIVMTICLWHIIRSPQGFNSGLYSPMGSMAGLSFGAHAKARRAVHAGILCAFERAALDVAYRAVLLAGIPGHLSARP
jgi:peptidoglycan/LPS O-acetylase OafA/YrhL